MYSREEKLKAVELLIKYDMSPASMIREIEYPCRATLCAWHWECLANGGDMPSASNHRRYAEGRKRTAVDHFFEHGQHLARTMRALGHPSQELLSAWIDELEPGRRPKRSGARRIESESHPIPLTLWIPFSTMCVRGEKARRYGKRITEIHRRVQAEGGRPVQAVRHHLRRGGAVWASTPAAWSIG